MSDDTRQYFEDLEVGQTVDCGSLEVTRSEMLEFAKRYDPQPIHVDEETATESMYGDLIASGWLTCALSMRLLVTGLLTDIHVLAARGIDDLRWHLPVYAGDELSLRAELVDKHAGDNPAFGHATSEITVTNQQANEVLTMTGLTIVEKRSGN